MGPVEDKNTACRVKVDILIFVPINPLSFFKVLIQKLLRICSSRSWDYNILIFFLPSLWLKVDLKMHSLRLLFLCFECLCFALQKGQSDFWAKCSAGVLLSAEIWKIMVLLRSVVISFIIWRIRPLGSTALNDLPWILVLCCFLPQMEEITSPHRLIVRFNWDNSVKTLKCRLKRNWVNLGLLINVSIIESWKCVFSTNLLCVCG